MNPDDREKFYAWYKDLLERDYNFDFQAEILSYCQSDVDILRRCCLEFRDLFCEVTDIHPFAYLYPWYVFRYVFVVFSL